MAGKRIAVLGFAFKKDTDDTRESPAMYVCRDLLAEKARVAIYDPRVPADRVQEDLREWRGNGGSVEVCGSAYEAAAGAHAIAVVTEWDEFQGLDCQRLYDSMLKPAFIFDGRNILDLPRLEEIGFRTFGIGKGREERGR